MFLAQRRAQTLTGVASPSHTRSAQHCVSCTSFVPLSNTYTFNGLTYTEAVEISLIVGGDYGGRGSTLSVYRRGPFVTEIKALICRVPTSV